jgi:hypothetical protein
MLVGGWLKEMLGSQVNLYLLGAVIVILAAGVVASVVADRRAGRQLAEAKSSPV